MDARYFIAEGDRPEREVTKEEYVRAERAAGFHNTLGQPNEPGTSSFSSVPRRGEALRGRTEYR